MTPAINEAKKQKIEFTLHKYDHDPSHDSYGKEAVEKLGIPEEQVFKTLVTEIDGGKLAVGIIPVISMLSMKQFAKATGTKKANMADMSQTERSTGYVLGGVSPLGQKKKLTTVIDVSAKQYGTIFVSAGRRGLDIELSPDDLVKLTRGSFFDICQE